MKKLLYSLFLVYGFIVLSSVKAISSVPVKKEIKNFSKNEYSAANQNWSVDYASDGYIYFANHSGLLQFDGINWKLYRLPDQNILRSVWVASDSLIYTGGYREIGYWKKEADNNLTYYSLNDLAGDNLSNNDEFWNIIYLNDTIYFHSFSKILKFYNNSFAEIKLPGFPNTIALYNNKVITAADGYGVFSLEGEEAVPLISDECLHNVFIRFLLPYKNNQLLIGTASDGIFIWDGTELREWNPKWQNFFKENEVNRAHYSENGNILIGTIINGIIIFNEEEEFVMNCNSDSGLQNNTILGITNDIYGNYWVALDSGVSFISDESEPGIKIETIPGIGSIYDIAVFEGKIYLGTNRGLFVKTLNDDKSDYRLVSQTTGQVWYCTIIDDQLFVGLNQGLLSIKNDKVSFISDQTGGFCIREDPLIPGRLVESTYSNMVILNKGNEGYRQTGTLKGFFDLIRYIEFDHLGNLWASHMYMGIYKLQLNNRRDSIIKTEYFDKNSAFGKEFSVHVFKIENRIVFTSGEKLYTYDDLNDSILSYDVINKELGHFAKAHRIITAPDNHYWFITNEKAGLFKINGTDIHVKKSVPIQVFTPNSMIDDFQNIKPLTASTAIICLEDGIAWIDTEIAGVKSEIKKYTPQISSVSLFDNQKNHYSESIREDNLKIKFKYHNIQVRYSFPHYTHNPVLFRAFLKGIDQSWSEQTTSPVFNYERLPPGNYKLYVKATDLWENESQSHIMNITILNPWYRTNYAKAAYVLSFFIIIVLLQIWGINRARKKERVRLEKREQELIKLRNEKLKNEIEHKSKELANSTMAIIKKNEFLLNLKSILARQKEQLGSRYPDKYFHNITKRIDNHISSEDEWKIFETNFERAHEQFLYKIKEQYPKLTPKDLRLCAFLRMNLSSKEIAPLLGISVRGVENHRYRLRKKMKLEHDDNLINEILKL